VLLRQTREAHALSFEEVEEQTRIRVKFLRALESGDISVLPSVAHAKGFLRNYAQFLHLDANTIVNQFVELTGSGVVAVTTPAAPPERSPAPTAPTIPSFEQTSTQEDLSASPIVPLPVPARPTSKTRPFRVMPDQWVGPAKPLGAIGRPGTPDVSSRPERQPSALGRRFRSNVLVGAVLAVGMIAVVWWVITQLSTVTGRELIPTEQVSISAEINPTTTSTGQTPTVQLTSSPVFTAEIPILGRVLLTITVTQRTWVRVMVDDEVAFEGQAEIGDLLQYTGERSVVVIAGNGAALDVTYNGQAIGTLGERGEAVERIFTPNGQATPTPTQTLTPTSTSVPSATPRFTQTPAPTRKP
jgi:cytoskeletal protein RodZ